MTDVFGPEAKVGDEVCIVYADRWTRYGIKLVTGRIEALTATQVVAIGGRRWLRRNGAEHGVGGSMYGRDGIQPLTEELRAQAAWSTAARKATAACQRAAETLEKARGDDAIRLAALLPAELTSTDTKET